ncbi:MAG: tetraacyldisaccharide 4'-kinase [Rhodocyclaceae bacterium]|nr:tetraacyldisaccharide 4'-kinase [Rhodocyclaceae bacterium]
MARLETFLLREWQRVSGWQLFLQPVSWVFQLLVWVRRKAFALGILPSRRPGRPVIVIGNISVGGTGKTPLVLALVSFFQSQAKTPGILTRGYMPSSNLRVPAAGSVIHVIPQTTPAENPAFADEAVLLSECSSAPVFAGANRVAVAAMLLQRYPSTDVLICDDGLQHYALQRDIEIAVVDASRGFGNGFCLPAGPLREPIARLACVDCIVLNGASNDGQFQAKTPEEADRMASLALQLSAINVPVFEMTYADARMRQLGVGQANAPYLSPTAFCDLHQGKRIVAIAGIGNPARFFTQLASLGVVLAGKFAFPDHHPFGISDLRSIDADIILMTEKDAVKCRLYAASDKRLWSMRVDAKLPEAFFEFVLKKLPHAT